MREREGETCCIRKGESKNTSGCCFSLPLQPKTVYSIIYKVIADTCLTTTMKEKSKIKRKNFPPSVPDDDQVHVVCISPQVGLS